MCIEQYSILYYKTIKKLLATFYVIQTTGGKWENSVLLF